MTRLHSFFSFLFMLSLSACMVSGDSMFAQVRGEGPITESAYKFEQFSGVQLHCSGHVRLRPGKDLSVRATSYQNILDALRMEVQNDVLHIRLQPGSYKYDKLDFFVSMPSLDKAVVSGSGTISAEGSFPKVDDMELRVSGSGDIELPVAASFLNTRVSGSGDIEIWGEADRMVSIVSGSGDIAAYKLTAKDVEATVSGSGDIEVTATGHLEARVSGSGDIDYRGNPTVNAKISGSGDVEGN